MLRIMKFDVLVSSRSYDKGHRAALKNIQRAGIPVNKVMVDTSKPVSYSRYKLFQDAQTEWVKVFDGVKVEF